MDNHSGSVESLSTLSTYSFGSTISSSGNNFNYTGCFFELRKRAHCSKTFNFLSCFLYYSLFLSNFSLTLVLILAFLVKVEFWMVFVLLCPVLVVF